MIRVDIESIIMASGPAPSVVVLRERKPSDAVGDTPLRALSIQTGAYEAAAIGHGIDLSKQTERPIAHDLLIRTINELGAKVERIEINRWDAPVFHAEIVMEKHIENNNPADAIFIGNIAERMILENRSAPLPTVREIRLDARPSDALAIATRSNAPIYVEDDVMNRAGCVSYQAAQESGEAELEKFDEFVQTLSPDDF